MRSNVISILIALVVAAIGLAAHAQDRSGPLLWTKWDTVAIRTNRSEPAVLDVQTSAAVSSVAIDFAAGGRSTFTSTGSNRWTTTADASKLLYDYKADDVNRNFVGFVKLFGATGETLATYNQFINVLDGNVPTVQVTDLGGGARATSRIVNLYRPNLTADDVQAAAQQFYTYYRDDFDFLQVVFSLPSYPRNRYHLVVRNDVVGIGLPIQSNAAAYGSAGQLQGITAFPIDTYFDLGESTFSHELGHQWINFLKNPLLQPGGHWPPSTMGRGIMGINIPGSGEGGEFPWNIVPVTSTTARTNQGQITHEYDDFDLYLMGFIPASAVSPGLVLQQPPCESCIIATTTITVNDVIQVNGTRVPPAGEVKTSFRIATMVISRDRLLHDDELAIFEYFAARGESLTALPYTSGFARGTTKPFYLATRGIGRVDFRLTLPPPRHRGARH